MQLWSEFLEAWPPDRVRGMSLEEYTNLNRDDAFSYWLEQRTKPLGGIRGGAASKFGIYRQAKKETKAPKGAMIWRDEYAWMRKYGATAEAAFTEVRSRLTDVIDAVRAGDFEAVDQVDFSPTVKWKVAFLYQDREDQKLLAIYSEKLLRARYAQVFPDAEAPPPSQQHAALIKRYSHLGDALDISRKIWSGDPPPDRRFWLMSLGRQSRRWPACYESGTATIGFDDYPVGDLSQYTTQDQIGSAMRTDPDRNPLNHRLALWEFSHVMKPSDVIFVKRGSNAIGHGTVRSDYRYTETRDRHQHVRDVQWHSNFPDGVRVRERPLVQKTLTDITKYPDQVRALEEAIRQGSNDRPHPHNRILYGPPGTGKTYATVGHALAVVDGLSVGEVTKDDKERYQNLVSEGRVVMVTFHQNYAYEDFVEGIRPALTPTGGDRRAESAELGYELRPGVLRRICEAAEKADQVRFVLIIDEINRGNIAKIFGELITLIEPSRRIGSVDATTVTLPYSGDEFGVPDNLYIIGTMNTADRSIQQLDTALRRRFTFVEMMPDPDHPLVPDNVASVNCRKMLGAMNERIALLMDREHQIGHTYLLEVESIEDLADRFRNRIFPLLQEYFYDDWRRIDAVLGGNAFVRKDKTGNGYSKLLIEKLDLVDEERVTHERLPDDDPAWNRAEEYQRIYEPKSD
ncbi:MAG: AAA family ATPase [Chloroflexi bacterium]|nr:AAA family ATPase [Chloroflexota bacterium]